MSCLFCKKQLELVAPFQPYGGGEVQFLFAYGSCKYDLDPGITVFRACVCDECAEGFVSGMEQK